jgi:hypothetical protein
MRFRFFHASLPIGVAEEFECCLERLVGIVHHVGKCFALAVV